MTLTMSGVATQKDPSPLRIVVRLDRASSVIVLRGDVDAYSWPALSEALSRVIASRQGEVVVDLADVAFIDSAGVHALAVARDLLIRRARSLTLRSPSTTATKVLGVFGLSDLIDASQERLP
jgi:anti-sigma B factor antagonist